MNVSRVIAGLCLIFAAVSSSYAQDWLTSPSFYSHSQETGDRVAQYSPDPAVNQPYNPSYMSSGYRQFRSRIGSGGSVDNYHIVQEWGRPVRPYGEWLHPYRPYSVPYQLWGAPYQGLGPTFNNNFGGFPQPYGPAGGGGYGPGGGGPGAGYGPGGGGYPGYREGDI
ncbi:hypothetical protein [Blastopirellula marina]|nr:hypothetical protein [Blastopirellula marina]